MKLAMGNLEKMMKMNHSRKHIKTEKGVTLIETLIVVGILGILVGILLIPFFISAQNSMKIQANYMIAEQNARCAVSWLTARIRGAYQILDNQVIDDVKFESQPYGTMSLISYSTNQKGDIVMRLNPDVGTDTIVWNIYRYRLIEQGVEKGNELREEKYEALNTRDNNPLNGSWTCFYVGSMTTAIVASNIMLGTLTPGLGTPGLQFKYWDNAGNGTTPVNSLSMGVYVITEGGRSKSKGTNTPFYQQSRLQSDIITLRRLSPSL
ncbi:MAG: type II secretion system protein [bacterium]